MAGLLDGYVGDDTVKDEYGMTQADRREPIWSGLIKAGLLAVAGGGNIMPEQRAQYLAQAGGALGDIPGQMVANASAHAQQQLRGQQVAAGKAKLANQAKLSAYANSPEGKDALSKLSAAQQFAAKAALDGGDIDAFQRIVSGADTVEHKARMVDLKEREVAVKEAAAANKAGGLDAAPERAAHGYLIRALSDPAFAATPQYAWALDFLSKPQKLPDGSFTEPIDKSRYPVATHPSVTGGTAQPVEIKPDTPMTRQVIEQIGKDMTVNEDRVVNGVTITKDNEGTLSWDTGSDTREGNRYRLPIGGKQENLPQLKPPPPAIGTALTNNMTTISKLEAALSEMAKNPDAWLGGAALLPDFLLQRTDPEGQRARDIIGDLGSVILHDRSGAALSAAELARLKFIPKTTDTGPVLKRKLEDMKRWTDDATRGIYETVGRDTKVPSAVRQRFGKPVVQADARKDPDDYKPDGTPLWRHKDGQLYTVPE